MSKVNPYTSLQQRAREWATNVAYPREKTMFTFSKQNVANDSYTMRDIRERVAAAETLGWRVEIRTNADGGMRMVYVKNPPVAPCEFAP